MPGFFKDAAPLVFYFFQAAGQIGALCFGLVARFICSQATCIMGTCDTTLEYGLSHAGRTKGPQDLFFPLGYSLTQLQDETIAEVDSWYDNFGIGTDAFVGCFFGTIGRFFDLGTVIEGAKRLNKEFPFRLILGGDGSSLEKFKAQAAGI